MIKAVLPNADSADCEGIINWVSTLSYEETVSSDGNNTTVTVKNTHRSREHRESQVFWRELISQSRQLTHR